VSLYFSRSKIFVVGKNVGPCSFMPFTCRAAPNLMGLRAGPKDKTDSSMP